MLTLYQFNSCPFCWKVKALLNFAGQPYEIVEVSPFGMKELNFTDHKKVPVLKDGEAVIVESAAIVEHVNKNYSKLPMREDAAKWTHWIDDVLVHYLPALIHPDFRTSFKNFSVITKGTNMGGLKKALSRLVGAMVMPRVARKMKARHGIQDEKAEFLEAIDKWANTGLTDQLFFGGGKPDFIDCSVFGVLHSSDALGVIDMAKEHNAKFAEWYDACLPLMSIKPS